jgi:hypothetical protein
MRRVVVNAELQQRAVPDDDLSRVREGIRAFLIASVRRPELVRLMNQGACIRPAASTTS